MKNLNIQKSKLLTSLTVTLFFLSSCQSFTGSKNKTSKIADPSKTVISTYNNGKITLQDVNNEIDKLIVKNKKLKGLTFEKLTSDQKELVVKEAVFNKIARIEAKKRKLNKNKDYKEAIRFFENELLKQVLLSSIAEEAKTEENLKKNYDELVEQLKDKKDLRISYIALNSEKKAKSLYKILLKRPSSFAYQAKRKSIDKETAKKGGDLGFILEDSLPKDLVKVAKTLNNNQVSKPIAIGDRWVIIRLKGKRSAEILSFDKAKDSLSQNLAKKAIADFISESLEQAEISVLIK